MAPLLQFLVHEVEEHVGQERRDRSSLRSPLVSLHDHPVDHDPCFQVPADQPQHPFVLDPLRQFPHQDVPVDPVEKSFQINVNDPAAALLDVPLCTPYGIVRPAARTEPVAVIGKRRVEDRLEDLKQGLLDQAIRHGRDAKLALAPSRLRDRLPSDQGRLVGAREEFPTDSFPVLPRPLRQLFHRHAVDPGTALVFPHSLVRGQHVRATDHPFHEAARS